NHGRPDPHRFGHLILHPAIESGQIWAGPTRWFCPRSIHHTSTRSLEVLPMLDKSAFSEAIDSVLQDEGRVTAALVPGVFQPGEQPLAARYRPRHQIEVVRRIWASADTHSLALVAMLREDYDAARLWAEYIGAELNLDKANLEQAAQHG